ncbi:hypothetical protein [Nostoc piscinale]|uniref:hypothetical protein n=1 Tax=Nostoc piscinale TaxID=224012 RepID=UPI00190FD25F|nr:hypothetical protein [Nostoc piscinale]
MDEIAFVRNLTTYFAPSPAEWNSHASEGVGKADESRLKSSQRVAEVPSVVATGVGNPPTALSPQRTGSAIKQYRSVKTVATFLR